MSNTLNLGDGKWARKEGSLLAYNSENSNFKPLPFTFDRASSATVVNKQGLIETVGTDEPRIDFLNNSKGHLLLEPQRTNLIQQSNKFDTYWTLNNITVASGQIGVGGNSEAWKITASSGSGEKKLNINLAVSGNNAISIYAKKGTKDYVYLRGVTSGFNKRVYFNLDNGTIETDEAVSSNITDMGNGWYRCEAVFNQQFGFEFFFGIADSDNAPDYTDDGTGTIYVQYSQAEAGSYATSYIPTQGSAVTRSAEQGVDGGAGAPVFSNTSAVWFIDLERIGLDADSSGSAIALRNSSFSQQIRLHFYASDTNIRLRDALNGFATISKITGMSAGVRKKIALRIDGSALSTFANGSKIGSDYTAPSSFNIDEIDFATLGFKLYDMKFYNTALTDAELIALTS